MMRFNVGNRTVQFLLTQGVILVMIMLVFIVMSSVLFVRNAVRWQQHDIEGSLLMFAQQAAHSGEVPRRGDLGTYTFFIIDTEGRYILPRLPRSDEGEVLWQEHEAKLIYEMQKKHDGWSYYPDKASEVSGGGQYFVRYVFLEKQGWIVAAEGYIPGASSLLKGFLTPKLFMGTAFILLCAFGLMLFNAFWHFDKVMKAVLRSQEDDFISVPALRPGDAASRQGDETSFVKPEDRVLSGVTGRRTSIMGAARPVEMPLPVEPVEEETVPAERVAPELKGRPLEKPQPAGRGPQADIRPKDDLRGVMIDTTGIKSAILRRAIEEMRVSGK